MAYPPLPHRETDNAKMRALVRNCPFAHVFTSAPGGQRVTRMPVFADFDGEQVVRLRAHLNRKNPQAADLLAGTSVLVAFSGADSYVSPNWRRDRNRGPTWDYTGVHIWGEARPREDRAFFEALIDDFAGLLEPRYTGISHHPDWRMADAPRDYVDRLFPQLLAFEVAVSHIEAIAKYHQDFPADDAQSVASHLDRTGDEAAKIVASEIRAHRKS